MIDSPQYRFRSDRWAVEPGEDEDINPRMYGRQLANWLKAQLESRGYAVEQVIEEDWGRCLMVAREPFALWVGCGSQPDFTAVAPDAPDPCGSDIIWVAFATAEVPLLKRWFGKVDPAPALAALDAALRAILADAQVEFVGT